MKLNLLSFLIFFIRFKSVVHNRLMNDLVAVRIIKRVGKYYSLPRTYYKKDTRLDEFVFGRYVAMYFCVKNTELTFKQIGYYFKRSHSSVSHGVVSINNRLDTDKEFNNKFTLFAIKHRLKY